MKGGIARWKRGVAGQGVRQAVGYALGGSCDAHHEPPLTANGEGAAAGYATNRTHRFIVIDGAITVDALNKSQLQAWVGGYDPITGAARGWENPSPDADLLLDATVNAPKTFSIAAMLDPELAAAYEELQDRIRDRTVVMWQQELNARRGHAGARREALSRIEVVELRHERSRSLDPHKHRHLWLSMKVQGVDGRWSNVDSRVAMKFQNVVNAEGELAARTDPQWVAALAAKGLTLDDRGEVAALAPLVRPLSKRSGQIEANRTAMQAEWNSAHPDQVPTAKDEMAIDRRAWAYDRPNKPAELVEEDWAATVRSELAALDSRVLTISGNPPVTVAATLLVSLDRSHLSRLALAEADKRSAATGGRFSRLDVRAGVVRAVAASGVVGDRTSFDELIEQLTAATVTDLCQSMTAATDGIIPDHVKNLMATGTVRAKRELSATLDRIAEPGQRVSDIAQIANHVLNNDQPLDADQLAAAAIVAGTDRLTTVTGAAGSGKTTMLRVAAASLKAQGRTAIVVAPTKKASSIVGREIGADASSVHALLLDHGWRLGDNDTGTPRWVKLRAGHTDPTTGTPYRGPRRYPIDPGDRIIVDEAGMLDLHTAVALTQLASTTGAGIAFIGDHRQVQPVGHSGAMALARQAATANTELLQVHRFKNPNGTPNTAYAELSVRLREPEDEKAAIAVATELVDGGHVIAAANQIEAREVIVERYFDGIRSTTSGGRARTVAIVTATNDEAQLLNEAIQTARIQNGELPTDRSAAGQNDQLLYVGDVIQTRRNSRGLDVENRQLWRIQSINATGKMRVESTDTPGMLRDLDSNYTAQHVHLAYAATVHGIQGETTDTAIVGPGVTAEGLYVGLTRGRTANHVVTLAHTRTQQIDNLAQIIVNGKTETTLEDNREATLRELARAARVQRTSDRAPVDPHGPSLAGVGVSPIGATGPTL
jgi:exodeoxyribonuclease V alpha subunit